MVGWSVCIDRPRGNSLRGFIPDAVQNFERVYELRLGRISAGKYTLPLVQKHYIHGSVLGESIFGSLHNSHVAHYASRLGKPEFCDYIQELWGNYFRAVSLHGTYVTRPCFPCWLGIPFFLHCDEFSLFFLSVFPSFQGILGVRQG